MTSINFSSLQDRKPIKVTIDGEDICLTRVGDQVFAIGDLCTHSDASLSEGDVTDFKIECWLHGAEFDLRTGEVATPPASIPVETFEVKRNGDELTISSRKSAEG